MENRISFEGYSALVVANDKIEAVTLIQGASLVSLTLREGSSRFNPLWNPQQIARDHGEEFSRVFPRSPGFGHFVCVDGFGPGSPEEQAAGLPMHGEAHQQLYEIQRCSKDNHVLTVTLSAKLPLVEEKFTRTLRLVDGEHVLYFDSELENLLAFDRPVNWAEHATIGAPYLERGKTVVDMPAACASTRDYPPGEPDHRLAPLREFTWPLAPSLNRAPVDLRAAGPEASGDHTTCLMPRDRPHAFVSFLHPERHKLLGYVFRHEEFPWVQNWEYYPADGQLARGLEFSTQPYDVPRREAIQTNSMFGTLTYRWLPAKSTIASKFLVFWTDTPPEFTKIDDVRIEAGVLTVSDVSGHVFTLAASLGL